jgi:hypothetical protein
VYLSTASHPKAVAQIDSSAGVHAGQSMPVFFDMARVHFFEPGENGKTLARNSSVSG